MVSHGSSDIDQKPESVQGLILILSYQGTLPLAFSVSATDFHFLESAILPPTTKPLCILALSLENVSPYVTYLLSS